MKQDPGIPYHYNSLIDLHRMLGLPKPSHPLISLINNVHNHLKVSDLPDHHTSVFYKISLKQNLKGKLKYGQQYYDFDDGGLFFVSPNQVTSNSDNNDDHSGYTLIIHPDFLLTYPLASTIKRYGFFSYSANEALHLSAKEKETIISIFKNIDDELKERLDDFSQDVIISQIESLLNYSNRFYKRQFLTRKTVNTHLLQKMEAILDDYFNDEKSLVNGIPTVQYMADELHLSPSYLSDMLRSLTGQNAQQHIQIRLIEKAKEKLSTTDLSVSQIAYELGFEHLQSFTRLFKSKTNQTPLEFRQSFS
ncbi:helix-turn-helix domain-containing protein [Chryseobacterium daecheongense]|uniref:AraC family transcriptional regulator n=1 Tax=Chryseobacterium daecheongense TaxID=192389 RepID=A0A3N0VXC2_9FLAO|nr:response regulator transcription factor [Chryseobacterium daecheongense]ROH97407.1 AraC family transcriptional regulator [Chryseobacterium daecheongense]TDX93450.1 helix-turn-helix protein [Chryseobacterium daecheongense]